MTESTTGWGQQDRDRSWHHFSEVLQGCNSFLVLNQETDALCSVPSLPFPAAVKLTAICNQYRPCWSHSVAGQKGSGAVGCCMPAVPSSCVQLEVPSPPLPLRLLLAGCSRCTVRTGALHGGGGWQMQEHSFLSLSSIFSLMLFHIYWLPLYSTGLAGYVVTSLPILHFQLSIISVQFQVPQSHLSLHEMQSLAHKHQQYIPASFLKAMSYAAHQPFLCSQHLPETLFPNIEQCYFTNARPPPDPALLVPLQKLRTNRNVSCVASNSPIPSPRQCVTLGSMRVPEAHGKSHPFTSWTAQTNHTTCKLPMCIASTVPVIQNHQRQLWEHFLYSFTQALASCKYSSPLNLIHHHICVQGVISSDTQKRWNKGLPKPNSRVWCLKLTA